VRSFIASGIATNAFEAGQHTFSADAPLLRGLNRIGCEWPPSTLDLDTVVDYRSGPAWQSAM